MRIERSALSPAYGFCDPHGGKADLSRVGSRAALVIGCADSAGRIFILHAWAGRVTTVELMHRIEQAIERYALKTMGVETDGLAGLWADAMRVNAALRMKRMPLMSVTQPRTQEKIFRIRTTLQPVIQRGLLFLQDDQVDLRTELTSFPLHHRMDMVDALASLVRHVLPPVRHRAEERMQDDALLAYLRATGAPPQYINAVAHDRFAEEMRTYGSRVGNGTP